MSKTSVNSVMTQKMMDYQVQPDTFMSLLHCPSSKLKWSLDELLDSFKSQFVTDETSIGMANQAEMQIDKGNSDPVSQKPYPIATKHCDCVKDEIKKLLDLKVIWRSHSSWPVFIIVVPKDDG